MSNIPKPLVDLLNQLEPGWHAFCYMVPHRILRITRSEDWCKWRVEQFVLHNRNPLDPRGAWRTLHVCGGDKPGVSGPAVQFALAAQRDITAKIQKRAAQIQDTVDRVRQQ